MPIRKAPGGRYVPTWRDMLAKGRARNRAARPKRDVLTIRTALKALKLRYCQEVSFWNPRHTGKHGDLDGGLQWVDFVVRRKQPFVIILDDPKKRWKLYEQFYLSNKQWGLRERNIPYILLGAGMTSQEYQVLIYMNMKRKGVW
jgi:hypothetical protein